MKQLRGFIFALPLYIVIPLISDKYILGYYLLSLSTLIAVFFWRIAFRTKNNLFSPVSMFVSMYNIFFLFGLLMWIIREKYFDNWDGDFFLTVIVYSLTSYTLSFWGSVELCKKPKQEPPVFLYQLKLTPIMLFSLFVLEYLGIYLFTAGFKVIPLLAADIDEARIELNSVRGAGAGIGAILVYCGVLCIYHALSIKTHNIIEKTYKWLLFLFAYVPFLLYGGRLLMALPLLILIILTMVKNNFKLNLKHFVSLSLGIIFFFIILMLYGTLRLGNDIDNELFLNFLTADLFPEFRGSVAVSLLNNKDLGSSYLEMIFSRMFPGAIADFFGIDKTHQIDIGGYVANLLGLDLLGIRTSLSGELLMTSEIWYVFYLLFIFSSVILINKKYFKSYYWGKNKFVYMYIGLFWSLIIPYGIGLIPNAIIITIIIVVLKMSVYSRTIKL